MSNSRSDRHQQKRIGRRRSRSLSPESREYCKKRRRSRSPSKSRKQHIKKQCNSHKEPLEPIDFYALEKELVQCLIYFMDSKQIEIECQSLIKQLQYVQDEAFYILESDLFLLSHNIDLLMSSTNDILFNLQAIQKNLLKRIYCAQDVYSNMNQFKKVKLDVSQTLKTLSPSSSLYFILSEINEPLQKTEFGYPSKDTEIAYDKVNQFLKTKECFKEPEHISMLNQVHDMLSFQLSPIQVF